MTCHMGHVEVNNIDWEGEEVLYIVDFGKKTYIVYIMSGEDRIEYYESFESLKEALHNYPWNATQELLKETKTNYIRKQLLQIERNVKSFLETLDLIEPPTHIHTSD